MSLVNRVEQNPFLQAVNAEKETPTPGVETVDFQQAYQAAVALLCQRVASDYRSVAEVSPEAVSFFQMSLDALGDIRGGNKDLETKVIAVISIHRFLDAVTELS